MLPRGELRERRVLRPGEPLARDAVEEPWEREAADRDPRALALGDRPVARELPLRDEPERLLRGELEPREVHVLVVVEHLDEPRARLVGRLRDRACKRRVLDVRLDRNVLPL